MAFERDGGTGGGRSETSAMFDDRATAVFTLLKFRKGVFGLE